MTPRLTLFGAPTLVVSGQSRALDCERRTQLLVYLALKRAWVGRPELAALLWPEQPAKLAYTNLRKALHRLQSLPLPTGVETQGNALRFEADTDVHTFDVALREGRLGDAIALFRGGLLQGFDDADNDAWSSWLRFERERLRGAWRAAAQRHLQGELAAVEAVELALRLVNDDRLDEDAFRLYMEGLMRSGEAAKARNAYREFVTRLKRELQVEPSAELRSFATSATAVPQPSAKLHGAADPSAAQGFIGRSVELRKIASLLAQDDCRLLTLTGPGGVGKTRLARRVLEELATQFPDGATFVPLEELNSAHELGARIAHELGVILKGRSDPMQQVIEATRDARMLLVLDNFEHIVDGAGRLEPLLALCPLLKLLVTSRVRLALPAEWLLPLEGLPYPELEDREYLESFDAARLFIRAAQRIQPDFNPSAEGEAIVEVCRCVQGLPLALELAASWTRLLSCTAIAAELKRDLELLVAADAAQPARHANMQVVFEQSWRLLSDRERSVLARLSVFDGGFQPDAARSVVGTQLAVLAALIDKSLVAKEQGRLHLHPLVRHFAAARLGEGDAVAAAHAAHARYYAAFLNHLRRPVDYGDQDALNAVEAEFDNCRTAWRWAASNGLPGELLKSAGPLLQYCDHRSRLDEGLALFREALDVPAVTANAVLAALLLSVIAHLEYRLDRYDEAMQVAALGLERLRLAAEHSVDTQVRCLRVLGTCQLRLGRLGTAARHFQASLALADACSDLRHRSSMLSSLALVRKMLGDYDDAQRLSIEALEEQRRLGDVAGEALSLNNLAALHLERRQYEAAAHYLRPALELSDRLGLATTRVFVLTNLAGVEIKLGRHDSAQDYAQRAMTLAQSIGNRFVTSFLRFQFVRLALHRGDLADARAELKEGMALASEVRRPNLLTEGSVCLALVLAAQGDGDCAHAVARFALEHPDTAPMEQDEIRHVIEELPPRQAATAAWPDISLGELARRAVVEAPIAYAPLIAAIRAAR